MKSVCGSFRVSFRAHPYHETTILTCGVMLTKGAHMNRRYEVMKIQISCWSNLLLVSMVSGGFRGSEWQSPVMAFSCQ
jgi:hypothetical protein